MNTHARRRLLRAGIAVASLGMVAVGMWRRFGLGCALLTVGVLVWIDLNRTDTNRKGDKRGGHRQPD